MKIKHLLFIVIPFLIFGCEKEEQSIQNLEHLTSYDLGSVPEIELSKDYNYLGASQSEVKKIGDVAVDEAGNVYLVDQYRKKIQIYNSNGFHLGSIGKAGGDPGEFQKPGDLQVIGRNLIAFDQSMHLAYQFTLDDHTLRSTTRFNTSGLSEVDTLQSAVPFSYHLMEDGNFLVAFQVVSAPDDRRLFYYRVDPAGDIISDQLMAVQNKSLYVDEGMNKTVIMMLPYERETLLATDSQLNIYTAHSENFLLKISDTSGVYQRAWHYPFENKSLQQSDAVNMFNTVNERRAIRGADLPSAWPALARLIVDDKDRLWVATITGNLENYRWYVLNNSGEPMGSFEFPRNKEIMTVKDNLVYTKELNVKYYSEEIVRYEINF